MAKWQSRRIGPAIWVFEHQNDVEKSEPKFVSTCCFKSGLNPHQLYIDGSVPEKGPNDHNASELSHWMYRIFVYICPLSVVKQTFRESGLGEFVWYFQQPDS